MIQKQRAKANRQESNGVKMRKWGCFLYSVIPKYKRGLIVDDNWKSHSYYTNTIILYFNILRSLWATASP